MEQQSDVRDKLLGYPGHQVKNSKEMFPDTLPGSPGHQ